MLNKFFAIIMLGLVASPMTAPFRTWDAPPMSSHTAIDDNDPGSLVVPLAIRAGRLKIAKAIAMAVVCQFVPESPCAFVTRTTASADASRGPAAASTVLRI